MVVRTLEGVPGVEHRVWAEGSDCGVEGYGVVCPDKRKMPKIQGIWLITCPFRFCPQVGVEVIVAIVVVGGIVVIEVKVVIVLLVVIAVIVQPRQVQSTIARVLVRTR